MTRNHIARAGDPPADLIAWRRAKQEHAFIVAQRGLAQGVQAHVIALDDVSARGNQFKARAKIGGDDVAISGGGPANLVSLRIFDPNPGRSIASAERAGGIGSNKITGNMIGTQKVQPDAVLGKA